MKVEQLAQSAARKSYYCFMSERVHYNSVRSVCHLVLRTHLKNKNNQCVVAMFLTETLSVNITLY